MEMLTCQNIFSVILTRTKKRRIVKLKQTFFFQNTISSQLFSRLSISSWKEHNSFVKASFRGYPLHGQIITLPHNYQGIVLKEMKKPLTEDAERNFHTTHIFRSLTYWNWDLQPSRNDAFISALDWIDVAEALHAPVEKD
ncbi:ribonuclease H2 subunit C isoform X1 [Anabrus simplex]|uniref:ribonuclease H2 subunit C isoform X1 n=1 Tax=Anabrus simplex TaxID=316456 RepID=UPI0034DD979F